MTREEILQLLSTELTIKITEVQIDDALDNLTKQIKFEFQLPLPNTATPSVEEVQTFTEAYIELSGYAKEYT